MLCSWRLLLQICKHAKKQKGGMLLSVVKTIELVLKASTMLISAATSVIKFIGTIGKIAK